MRRRARRVRLQFNPGEGPEAIEGVQYGGGLVGGFHVVHAAKVWTSPDTSYEAGTIEVHTDKILFRQVL